MATNVKRTRLTWPGMDVVVNLVILVTCAIVGAAILQRPRVEGQQPVETYKIGDRAEKLPGVDYGASGSTLVFYVKSSCHYCSASMAFYRNLASQSNARVRTRLVAVSPEDERVLQQYLADNNLTFDQTVSYVAKVQGTPTVLLVTHGGIIEKVWFGLQNEAGQKDMMRALLGNRG